MKLTKTGQRFLDAMRAAEQTDVWERVPDALTYTLRHMERDLATPSGLTQFWPFPTYNRHVFVAFTGRSVIVGVSRSPWTGRYDFGASYREAFAVLENPSSKWA